MLSERLKLLRNQKAIKQSEIANYLGIDRTTYSKYETGDSNPDYETLCKLAEFYDTTTDYLLGRTNIRNPEQIFTLAANRKDGYDKPLTEDEKELIDNILAAYRKSKEAKKE